MVDGGGPTLDPAYSFNTQVVWRSADPSGICAQTYDYSGSR